ncbi:HD domain-containing protein [Deinococcus radiomollis]|uniref:HD domain-containing protein n=1 Tax=Deinococcus radiomollis TaxID=468916 RepID=UPI0038921E90
MAAERRHEIKDPVHGFVRLSQAERLLLDSAPVQRLRHIHQLAYSGYVYPGATHKRFEHSLGVMHLAGLAYDALLDNAERWGAAALPSGLDLPYWRRVLRAAALLHDVGHLPFSHAAEDLLPDSQSHEHLSRRLILSGFLAGPLAALDVKAADVAQVAVGQETGSWKTVGLPSSTPAGWVASLSSLITGDAFGADRIDYLLRDAYHSGAVMGTFDAARLIDRLVLLYGTQSGGAGALQVGLHSGALQAAEALLTTRDALYEGLYFHPVRRIYDHHLGTFLRAALGTPLLPQGEIGGFSGQLERHLALSDNEVFAAIRQADLDPLAPGHRWARRLERREHFRLLYRSRQQGGAPLVREIAVAAREAFGPAQVVYDPVERRPGRLDFPLLGRSGVSSAQASSRLLRELPPVSAEYVFVAPEIRDQARLWLRDELRKASSRK